MTGIDRRRLGQLAAGAGFAAIAGASLPRFAIAQTSPKVVIVGGGAGGASLAQALKKGDPKLDVTLIEANPIYSTSFFSNLYLGGLRSFASLNHNYVGLTALRVRVVPDFASDVDTTRRLVKTRSGRSIPYDRLVLSPGIDIKFDSIAGYSREAAQVMPHAYTTDGAQKQLLKRQLDGMKDGGTVLMVMPNNPYRCPPGPYERACMIAHVLKTRKPKSKLVILDPKKSFSKQPVFVEAFEKHYKGIVELNLTTEIDDFAPVNVDAKGKLVAVKAGKTFRGDVVNVIPQQKAGEIAQRAGVTQGDWCPVDPATFAAKSAKDVFVIGDAAIAAEMPKSAFSANSQAKAVAAHILAELSGKERFPARYRNTCWSLVAPNDCVKIGANYAPKDGKLDPSGAFVSQRGEDTGTRSHNYRESVDWYASIVSDMFAKRIPGADTPAKRA